MVTPMNEKPVRKPRNVLIDPEALHRTRVEALRSKKTLGEWLEEAIEQKIEREQKKAKQKRTAATGLFWGEKTGNGSIQLLPLYSNPEDKSSAERARRPRVWVCF